MSNQSTGQLAEQAALTYLTRAGLQLITQNYSCRTGEIDLIMQHRSSIHSVIIVFVEVRYRQHDRYGGAVASVTHTKQLRLVRTARRFLQTHPRFARFPSRFDIVALTGCIAAPEINWHPGAFDC
jgi:putative endonuclease